MGEKEKEREGKREEREREVLSKDPYLESKTCPWHSMTVACKPLAGGGCPPLILSKCDPQISQALNILYIC